MFRLHSNSWQPLPAPLWQKLHMEKHVPAPSSRWRELPRDGISTARPMVAAAGVAACLACSKAHLGLANRRGKSLAPAYTLSALGRMSNDLAKAFRAGSDSGDALDDVDEGMSEGSDVVTTADSVTEEKQSWFAAKVRDAETEVAESGAVDVWMAAGAVAKAKRAASSSKKFKRRPSQSTSAASTSECTSSSSTSAVQLLEEEEEEEEPSQSQRSEVERQQLLAALRLGLNAGCEEEVRRILAETGEEVEEERSAIALALVAVADGQSDAVLRDELPLLEKFLPTLRVSDMVEACLWKSAWSGPVECRLALLDAMGTAAGTSAWTACGASPDVAAEACLEAATLLRNSGLGSPPQAPATSTGESRQQRYGRRPSASFANYAQWHRRRSRGKSKRQSPATAPRSDKEQEPLPEVVATQQARKRIASILQHLASTSALSSLSGREALMLVEVLGPELGVAVQHVLRPILPDLQRTPAKFNDAVIFSLAASLPDSMGGPYWPKLAGALVAHWRTLWSDELVARLEAVADRLQASPLAFKMAFTAEMEKAQIKDVFDKLTPVQLEQLMSLWSEAEDSETVFPLRQLLLQVADRQLTFLSAQQLVALSELLLQFDDSCGGSSREDLLHWWRLWTQRTIQSSTIMGCGRCMEALREVAAWGANPMPSRAASSRNGDVGRHFAEEILDDVLCADLCSQMKKGTFTADLLMELHTVASQRGLPADVRHDIADALEARLKTMSAGGTSGLPLPMCLRIVTGETPLPCPQGSTLWNIMIGNIALHMRTQQGVELFKQYRPSHDLIRAVLDHGEESDRHRLELLFLLQQQD